MGPITDAHKIEYGRNVQLAVQQKKSRFEQGFTYHDDWKGRVMIFEELMGSAAAIIDGARGGDTPDIDSQVEPVAVLPHQIEWGKLIEKEDAIKALTDYQSPFVQVGAAAIVRGRDTVFASALFGNRLIGQDGGTVQAWDSTNKLVAVDVGSTGTPNGMSIKKIQRAKRYLRAAYVDLDMEDLWGVLNAQQHEELYNDIVAVDTDSQRKDAVLDSSTRTVMRIAGVNFASYEGMTNFDGSTYTGAIWCKSGMHYGDFDPLTTTAERNPAKKYRLHPYMENWWGAQRSEDIKVIKVLSKI
jgi:hypothetical protein